MYTFELSRSSASRRRFVRDLVIIISASFESGGDGGCSTFLFLAVEDGWRLGEIASAQCCMSIVRILVPKKKGENDS